jgi:hypothetical protein
VICPIFRALLEEAGVPVLEEAGVPVVQVALTLAINPPRSE